MAKIMCRGIEYSGGGSGNVIELTLTEYKALSQEEQNNGTIYFVKDASPSINNATSVQYNNSESGLSADNVQDAIDETCNRLDVIEKDSTSVNLNFTPVTNSNYTVSVVNGGQARIVNGIGFLDLNVATTTASSAYVVVGNIGCTTNSTAYIGDSAVSSSIIYISGNGNVGIRGTFNGIQHLVFAVN